MFLFWNDNRTCSQNVDYVQRVTGSGAVAAGWPAAGLTVSTRFGGQGGAQAISDDDGGAIAFWDDYRSGEPHVYAQRIRADGTRLWGPTGIPLCDAVGSQVSFRALADGAGGAFIAWQDSRRGLDDGPPHHHALYDLYAQHVDAQGLRTWPAAGIPVVTVAPVQGATSLVTDGGSGVLITWLDGRGAAYLQHLDASGSAHLPQDGVAIPGRFLGQVTSDGAGGIISAFMYGPDTQQDLYAQRVDSTGALKWPLNGVLVASAPFDQRPNDILPDGKGGAFIAWYDLRNGLDWDVYLQRITAAGVAAPGWPANGLPVCTSPGFQIYPRLVPGAAGGCVLAWYDARDTSSAYDIYAKSITAQGAVSTGWPTTGALLCHATGDQVSPLPTSDGAGGALVAWTDYRVYADVYAQHVSGSGVVGDTVVTTGVATSGPMPFTLGRVFPNPLRGDALLVSLSLPDASPAELSLFDLRGRRMTRRRVQVESSGPVVITLHAPDPLAPGIYLLRLERAGRTISRKISVVR
jgi:hypothetical protein